MSIHMRGLDLPILDRLALFLDLDGTLAPIAATPDEVFLDAGVLDLLSQLTQRLDGRLAIISGRRLESLDRILNGRIIAAAGLHGLERRTSSRVRTAVPAHPGLSRAREEFQRLANVQPGLLVEDKELGIALHYRRAPGSGKTARALGHRLAAGTGLAVQEGEMVIELLTPGQDKGAAVLAFMAEAPFAGAIPVFVGDDLTDENAFSAASACGGFGIRVGPERETKARYRLADVDAALALLHALIEGPTA